MKQKDFKKEWSEEVKYIGEGKAILKWTQKVPTYSPDGKKVTGTNENVGEAECTVEELQGNVDLRRKTIDNLIKQKNEEESKITQALRALKSQGIPAKKTAEMVRLEKNIFALGKIGIINAAENNIRNFDDEIDTQLDAIKKREASLINISKQMEADKNGISKQRK